MLYFFCGRRNMAQETIMAEILKTADKKTILDEECKKVLANKIILAWIMKNAVEEYRDLDVNEIAERYMEGTPVIAQMAVHRDVSDKEASMCIHGEDTADKTITEGTVYFDIRFRAILPSNGEYITLLMNVEAQNDFYPGYSLVRRGIYYCCRMISGQYGTEFEGAKYGKIKKVYSIWICINPPKKKQHSITKYSITETNVAGKMKEAVKNYDLLTVIMLCLGAPKEDGSSGITELLSVLLSSKLDIARKKEILVNDFGMVMTKELETEVSQMCNYSDGVEQQGIQKGIQEGTFRTLFSLVQSGLLKLEDAAKYINLSEEDFSKQMKEAGY